MGLTRHQTRQQGFMLIARLNLPSRCGRGLAPCFIKVGSDRRSHAPIACCRYQTVILDIDVCSTRLLLTQAIVSSAKIAWNTRSFWGMWFVSEPTKLSTANVGTAKNRNPCRCSLGTIEVAMHFGSDLIFDNLVTELAYGVEG